jgi:outer membrane protein assembly factor BamD (BamD/ComL family)
MMKKVILISVALMSMMACSGPNKSGDTKASLHDSIAVSEDNMFNNENKRITRDDALDLIRLYEKYADKYPEDTLAPVYLFRASDISMNLQQPVKTIDLFNKIMAKYPDYEKTPSVMFLKAFVYEDQLHDLNKAKKYYEEFLEKYPDSDFADDARISLQNLGKSPEELIKEFEEKQQE